MVAVARNAVIHTSTDFGSTWTPRPGSGVREWRSVASSADGTRLVAVADADTVYTSADAGETWTAQPAAGTGNWITVASSADGMKLVAAQFSGDVFTSTDAGVNWTPRSFSAPWTAVASSADGTQLFAGQAGGHVYASADSGINWSPLPFPTPAIPLWVDQVASSADGGKLAMVMGEVLYQSFDRGATWLPNGGVAQVLSVAISADGNTLVASGIGTPVSISTDGGSHWSHSRSRLPGPQPALPRSRSSHVH